MGRKPYPVESPERPLAIEFVIACDRVHDLE
jgi:hypothetical protein